MITKKLIVSSAIASLVLIGCGGGGSSTSATTGYLVDSAIVNADYDCVADGNLNKQTGANGSFTCTDMSNVRFRIGKLVLGEIHTLHSDKHVFPQDLIGVARDSGVNDARVIAMAQLLQSLDSDGNPENGIAIAQESKEAVVETERTFNPAELTIYQDSASVVYRPTSTQAKQHLAESLQAVVSNVANAGTEAGTDAANAGAAAGADAAHAGATAGTNAANAGAAAGTSIADML